MAGVKGTGEVEEFLAARDLLLKHRQDYETAHHEFLWPELQSFNWASDYFDRYAQGNSRVALHIVDEFGFEQKFTYAEMARRSNQVANFLRAHGVRAGDRVIAILPNVAAIWELTLAILKLGAVLVPCAVLLTAEDLADRVVRGEVKHIVADVSCVPKVENLQGSHTRIVVGDNQPGWISYDQSYDYSPRDDDQSIADVNMPFLLYFTSGTTAAPKLVIHTQQSYPVGHLATMYWVGVRQDDVHLNISSPGWAKHAWSSVFAPWNAGATVFVYRYERFESCKVLEAIARHNVTSLCAPPTVWRMLILQDLERFPNKLRNLISAGEPLNPEIIARVQAAWNTTVRDGFGQTETVALLGNFPGMQIKPGAVGKPTPGHVVVLLDAEGKESDEGEIAVKLTPRPPSLMQAYADSAERTAAATLGGYYRTGDVARRDSDGYFNYVGRADDVFKCADYRLSPFELESALLEHEAIAEAAVVPSPDELRQAVPKAYITLVPDIKPSRDLALDIFRFIRGRLSPYKRIRRIEFGALPKTVSGKIRRAELRQRERENVNANHRSATEYYESDFLELSR